MGCKRYSKQPRGCAIAYLVHYATYFAPHLAENQWGLFKDLMFERFMGFWGFREYLPDYQGKMTPDSGLIIGGLGAAASGLAFKAASSMHDEEILKKLVRSAAPILGTGELIGRVPGLGVVFYDNRFAIDCNSVLCPYQSNKMIAVKPRLHVGPAQLMAAA